MLPMRPMKLGGEYLIFGENAISYLGELDGEKKKAFLVMSGDYLERAGFMQEIRDILDNAGFETESFYDVEPDPSMDTVLKGAEKMMEFEPDWIIAIGGGSAMDAAKAMWIVYEYPEIQKVEDFPKPLPKLRNKAKMVSIPTSSGTGSEVSRSIVITDKKTHIKHGIGDMEMMPDIAILEPKLTTSLPKGMTAATGMDALTHAIEARTSNRANILSDSLADTAIRMIFNNIVEAYETPNSIQAREQMLVGSMIAGMSFTNVSLGIVHSIAHAIGGKFGLAHGLLNAVILPYVIEFNSSDERAVSLYKEIAKLQGNSDNLIQVIHDYNEQLEIPKNLQSLINDDQAFEAAVDELSELALADGCTKTNPVIPTLDEFKSIIRKCYYGK